MLQQLTPPPLPPPDKDTPQKTQAQIMNGKGGSAHTSSPLPALSLLLLEHCMCHRIGNNIKRIVSPDGDQDNPQSCLMPQHGNTNAATAAGAAGGGGGTGRDTIAYAATASSQLDTHSSLEQHWLLVCVWEKGPSIWTDLVFERRTEKGT